MQTPGDPSTPENDWRRREHTREARELWRAVYAASVARGYASDAFKHAEDAVEKYNETYA